MVHVNKLVTRRGDDGDTDLVDGGRVAKADLRMDAVGDVDELNTTLGLLRTACAGDTALQDTAEPLLQRIQQDLFDIGSLLAAAPDSAWARSHRFPEARTTWAEAQIAVLLEGVPELTSFVLPGGTEANARAHLARAVCRRAERTVWRLHAAAPVDAAIRVYLNRLSDLLFALARWATHRADGREYLWQPGVART